MPVPVLLLAAVMASVIGLMGGLFWLCERNSVNRETSGLVPLILIPLGIVLSMWLGVYVNSEWEFDPPRVLSIQKMDSHYLAIDTKANQVYNILTIFGRVPAEGEKLYVHKSRMQLYYGVLPTEIKTVYEIKR